MTRQVVRELFDGNIKAVRARFDDVMLSGESEEKLAGAVQQYVDLFGDFRAQGRARTYDRSPITTITIALRMANRPGEARVSYDSAGKIAGLYLLRAGLPVPD